MSITSAFDLNYGVKKKMESFFNDEIVLFLEFIMIVFFTYTPIHCVGYYFQYKAQKRRENKRSILDSTNTNIQY